MGGEVNPVMFSRLIRLYKERDSDKGTQKDKKQKPLARGLKRFFCAVTKISFPVFP